jgi:hypothetical protein
MAINVNSVYRVVLSILNKEQRGYLTPDQFNRLGKQAQLDLFEKSFYDYNRQLTKRNIQGVNSEYGDIADNIEEKIDIFATSSIVPFNAELLEQEIEKYENPSDWYRTVQITTSDKTTEIEKVKKSEYTYLVSSKLTEPSEDYPIYYYDNKFYEFFPQTITNPVIDYIRKPLDPKWGYTSATGTYIYDSRTIAVAQEEEEGNYVATMGSTDFELHPSDETDLVIKILSYAGVIIKDPLVVQVAQQQEVNNINQENS